MPAQFVSSPPPLDLYAQGPDAIRQWYERNTFLAKDTPSGVLPYTQAAGPTRGQKGEVYGVPQNKSGDLSVKKEVIPADVMTGQSVDPSFVKSQAAPISTTQVSVPISGGGVATSPPPQSQLQIIAEQQGLTKSGQLASIPIKEVQPTPYNPELAASVTRSTQQTTTSVAGPGPYDKFYSYDTSAGSISLRKALAGTPIQRPDIPRPIESALLNIGLVAPSGSEAAKQAKRMSEAQGGYISPMIAQRALTYGAGPNLAEAIQVGLEAVSLLPIGQGVGKAASTTVGIATVSKESSTVGRVLGTLVTRTKGLLGSRQFKSAVDLKFEIPQAEKAISKGIALVQTNEKLLKAPLLTATEKIITRKPIFTLQATKAATIFKEGETSVSVVGGLSYDSKAAASAVKAASKGIKVPTIVTNAPKIKGVVSEKIGGVVRVEPKTFVNVKTGNVLTRPDLTENTAKFLQRGAKPSESKIQLIVRELSVPGDQGTDLGFGAGKLLSKGGKSNLENLATKHLEEAAKAIEAQLPKTIVSKPANIGVGTILKIGTVKFGTPPPGEMRTEMSLPRSNAVYSVPISGGGVATSPPPQSQLQIIAEQQGLTKSGQLASIPIKEVQPTPYNPELAASVTRSTQQTTTSVAGPPPMVDTKPIFALQPSITQELEQGLIHEFESMIKSKNTLGAGLSLAGQAVGSDEMIKNAQRFKPESGLLVGHSLKTLQRFRPPTVTPQRTHEGLLFPFPGGGGIFPPPPIAPLAPTGGFGGLSGKGIRSAKPQRRYTPSLIGIISGKTTSKLPSVLTGGEIRLPFARKKKRKR